MKKWQLQSIILLSVLFIGLNLFLILKKDSKIERIEHVNNWNKVQTGDIKQTLKKSGVIVPAEEHHIYYDESNGAFQEFLVTEGEEVAVGTPLFQYSPYNMKVEIKKLESERDGFKDKIDHMNDHILDLKGIRRDLRTKQKKEENIGLDYSLYQIEKEISQSQLEISLIKDDLSIVEKQIEQLQTESDSLVVNSRFEGIVKELKPTLQNPIITLASKTPSVKGSFDESDLKKVSEGMETKVWADHSKARANGTLQEISTIPEQEPNIDRPSLYPFTVKLDGDKEKWILGNHVGLSIITKEANNAIIVPHESIDKNKKKQFVYILNHTGTIEKREIQTGLLVNGKQEITSGLKQDEYIVARALDIQLKGKNAFITPLKTESLSKKDLKKNIKTDWKYILRGFVSF
ncbi:RND transporter [Bacillus sp. FJAT-29790]|uniref:efflux RND transporter periplasmic adaptor subunit n=1 Tax=Bacillus sp. FJAT-29790 TaxID=1895002 RepID=UPI001C210462|nr:HlyD family efflux transporter periplasmic adaptor subunit [Bacillus sp. FJAT-29790]MBU8881142.1 RND transporter [Bacillus sp. FJAT-29790]